MDPEKWIDAVKDCQYLPEQDLKLLCDKVCEILMEEGTVQTVSAPVTVCGDIHGQFYDLEELFRRGGQVPETKYIFMGDFVDRGHYSLETFTRLLTLKVKCFNEHNGVDLICRAHQLVAEGIKYMFEGDLLATVWSAPNYCYRCGNVAAILSFDENLNRDAKIFQAVPDENRKVPPPRTTPYFL
ncbi:serine/threonine-protein phosphatase 4 catalytic subunit [Salpingoeca rosetta]|uniref:protein-serine/threonine phosphatase n=1 Tax=Salpingoeca rosetta (strain ATCC 50818 / BSB-021) TaxID=946362 RepID=F2TWZ4_SALR5|nr:serine/threonine-protein phosphatase 4 catalytic subunit [Salpingoeca rosetta]EGD75903.1 serine/threonine-protein phosphatase 4 catalytic subunit [Salpingoeca rosetta]|eukprot:XP_004998079.1 serine/threonine-protein phosphatase 4 catalytic subunit [Salpingoeca rosetta]